MTHEQSLHAITDEVVVEAYNPDLDSLITPVNVEIYQKLLEDSHFDKEKAQMLVQGFKFGFDLGYRGPTDCKLQSNNLKFRVGNKVVLWNKIMKEVKEGRFAGGFRSPPFTYFIQSPLGKGFTAPLSLLALKYECYH